MKKLICMVALGAITSGSVFAVAPNHPVNPIMKTDTGKMKMKMKKKKMKKDTSMMKMKDTTKM